MSRDAGEAPVIASVEHAPEPAFEAPDDHSFLGLGITGWAGAAALYALAGVAAALVSWSALDPEAWPDSIPVFRLVVEIPEEPSAPTVAAPAAETPPVIPAPPSPTVAPPVETTPSPISVAEAPPPPPRKPHPPSQRAPAAVLPAAPPPPSEAQVAAAATVLPVPPLALPGAAADIAPHAIGACDPGYPAAARQRGLQGRVLLLLEISADGAVRASVKSSSGHAVLDDAALAKARGCRFAPATRGGVAVAGLVEQPFDFRLED